MFKESDKFFASRILHFLHFLCFGMNMCIIDLISISFHLSQNKVVGERETQISHSATFSFQVVIFSYLLIHGSYNNTSDRVRRMFLIQLMAADDTPKAAMHKSACQQMVLRGQCLWRPADITKRFDD